MSAGFVLFLLLITVILFATEKIPPDIVTLFMLSVLVITGVLKPAEAFAGFGSDFIIMLAAIFVISEALQRSHLLDLLLLKTNRISHWSSSLVIATVMLFTSGLSAFMNNTTVSALMVPPVTTLAKKLNLSPSKLLMPMAFAAIMGGTCTLIGTSTNIAGSAFMQTANLTPLSMFELLPIGVVIVLISIVYMATLGQRWLPNYTDKSLINRYDMRPFLSEVVVKSNSTLVGKPAFEIYLNDIKILKLIRGDSAFFPDSTTIIQKNDLLLVEGNREELMQLRRTVGIELLGASISEQDLVGEKVTLAEAIIPSYSKLVNNTLKKADFRKQHHLSVLAIHRKDFNFTEKIGKVELKAGDVLLIQGKKENIETLKQESHLVVINQAEQSEASEIATSQTTQKGWIVLAAFFAAIAASALDIIPTSIAFLITAIFTIAIRAIDQERAYNAVEWHLLALIGGMTAFGKAIENTGADNLLAQQIIHYIAPLGITAVLAAFMVLTSLLTQPMSNAAAAMVVLPIAIATAEQLGVSQRTFAIAVIIAASMSVLTPFEPACILVMGPGQYRVRHFLKIGGLLTILLLICMIFLVPLIWKL